MLLLLLSLATVLSSANAQSDTVVRILGPLIGVGLTFGLLIVAVLMKAAIIKTYRRYKQQRLEAQNVGLTSPSAESAPPRAESQGSPAPYAGSQLPPSVSMKDGQGKSYDPTAFESPLGLQSLPSYDYLAVPGPPPKAHIHSEA